MTEPAKPPMDAQVSTRVIGEYSPLQKQEFAILAGQIIFSQGQDIHNEEHVHAARAVVEDSIARGLAPSGNTWFEPDQAISPIVERGLEERARIVGTFKNLMLDSEEPDAFFDRDEIEQIRKEGGKVNALSPSIDVVESVLQDYTRRRRTVGQFRTTIIDKTHFAHPARTLRDAAAHQARAVGGRVIPEQIEHRLYRNLLLHLAAYQRPGIAVEPKDVAFLSQLWDTPEKRDYGTERIIEYMRSLAERVGADDPAVIAVYTRRILEEISLYMGEEIDIDALQVQESFIFTSEEIRREEKEISESIAPVEVPIFVETVVTTKQIARARELIQTELRRLEEEDIKLGTIPAYFDDLEGFSASDLLVLLNELAQLEIRPAELVQDIQGLIPLNPYIENLTSVDGAVVVQETGEALPGFDQRGRKYAKDITRKVVLHTIHQGEINLAEAALQFPHEFLVRIMTEEFLSDEQQQALGVLSDDYFVRVASEQGIGYLEMMAGIADSEVKNKQSGLALIIAKLPDERQTRIADLLKKIVRT